MFDKKSSEAVPAEVPEENFPAEFFLLIEDIYENKADKIPDGFIEERRMDIHHFRRAEICDCVAVLKAHTEKIQRMRGRNKSSVGFAIEEVAPSAEYLPDHNCGDYHIRIFEKVNLFVFCNEYNGNHTADNTAVNRKTAVPDGNDIIERMNVAVKDDIIKSCADDCGRHADERRIDNVVQLYLCSARTIRNICECEDYSDTDYDPIPHYRSAEKSERRISDGKFTNPQSRKRNV